MLSKELGLQKSTGFVGLWSRKSSPAGFQHCTSGAGFGQAGKKEIAPDPRRSLLDLQRRFEPSITGLSASSRTRSRALEHEMVRPASRPFSALMTDWPNWLPAARIIRSVGLSRQ